MVQGKILNFWDIFFYNPFVSFYRALFIIHIESQEEKQNKLWKTVIILKYTFLIGDICDTIQSYR